MSHKRSFVRDYWRCPSRRLVRVHASCTVSRPQHPPEYRPRVQAIHRSVKRFRLLQRQRQLVGRGLGWHAARPGFRTQQFHKLSKRHPPTPAPLNRHPFHLLTVVHDHQRPIGSVNLHYDLSASQRLREVVAPGTDRHTRILLHLAYITLPMQRADPAIGVNRHRDGGRDGNTGKATRGGRLPQASPWCGRSSL